MPVQHVLSLQTRQSIFCLNRRALFNFSSNRFKQANFHMGQAVYREENPDKEEPIQFSKYQTPPLASFIPPRRNRPAYEPFVVSLSTMVFLLYFLVLREENDIDELFDRSLYDTVPGLEVSQLKVNIDYNKEHGLSTELLQKRLDEIESKKAN